MGGIHLVTPGGNLQIVGPQSGVDLHRAGDNVGVIRARGVHPGTLDHHFPALDVKAGEVAVFHLRLAGGERGAVGVDKAAAATGNARRVGDHHLRFFTGNFDHAVELARIPGAHLVEDYFGFTPGEPRVACHHAAKVGLHVVVGVVKDHPFVIHVELGVVVARHPGVRRGLDIDLRRTVGTVDHRRLLVFRCTGVGNDVGLRRVYRPHRQPQAKAEGAYFANKTAVGLADTGRTGRTGAAGAGDIRHHHQHAARFVKDNSVQVLIHGSFL
ncbi:hypothetical protein D3C75_349150 [compost metagenome]